ncbi:putative transcription factor [Corchorus olitorius]|uniref:Transcription factor n=1 Tax=Corchorus olitorius TaxID=93759 RepID=A0A1R3J8V7_9ROSI|nr:putative transcription factor [Corchorus olitorius]
MEMARVYGTTSAPSYDLFHQDYNTMMPADRIENYGVRVKNDETLALFPLHPTGIIEGRATNNISSNTFSENSTPSSSCETTAGIDQEAASATEQPFFDFFSSHHQGSCQSD